MKNLWGGRFEGEPSDLLRVFNDSFAFDFQLFAEDVEGSIAWTGALERVGVLTADESKKIIEGLRSVGAAFRPPSGLKPAAPLESFRASFCCSTCV